jgi:hypothetical protein
MPLRFAQPKLNLVKQRLGPDATNELQELLIYCLIPANLRRILALDTPLLDRAIGVETVQELKSWVQGIVDTALWRSR